MWQNIFILCLFSFQLCITSSFDLDGVMSGNRMAGVPLGPTLGDGVLDIEGICSHAGVTCQNCSHVVTCVSLPRGWLKVPLQECPEDQTCNAQLGGCSDQVVPECDIIALKHQHICEQVGIFPDAFDCRKFHLCSPPDGLPDGRPADHRVALCPRHYGYDPRTAQCSIRLDHGQCTQKPVPDCVVVGQTEALVSSPNHYYICLIKNNSLYPQIFICPHGWYFYDGFCRPEPPKIYQPINENRNEIPIPRFNYNQRFDGKRPSINEERPNEREGTINREARNEIYDKDSSEEKEISHIDKFFSTEKATTYAADSFLADKFDVANYESTDDVAPPQTYFDNSFETGFDFW